MQVVLLLIRAGKKIFRKFLEENPGRTVITYVNTNTEIKALSDIICTSSNAVRIIESLPKDEKIIFAPDRNLGNYILNKTGRDMVIWNGACHVHEEFSLEAILDLKKENPEAKVIVHPECELPVRMIADYIGSTSALLEFTRKGQLCNIYCRHRTGYHSPDEKE